MTESKWIKNWFSNMIPFDDPLVHEGISYPAVENFYQAMKTLDVERRKEIAAAEPRKSKRMGRDSVLREDWSKVRHAVMRQALDHKFKLGTTHGNQLLETDGEIVEWNNWGDEYWGKDVRTNNGTNHLGKMLMEIRSFLYMEAVFS